MAENRPDYRMSDLAARQNATIPPGATGYTPNPYTPYPQQQQQQQPQHQNPGKGVSAMDQNPPAYGEETKDNFDTNSNICMIQLTMKISQTNNAIQLLFIILVATIRNYSRYHVSLVFAVHCDF